MLGTKTGLPPLLTGEPQTTELKKMLKRLVQNVR